MSLIEVCVTIAVLGIITGVGTVQFNKYMAKSNQDSLCDHAIIFKTALNSCVQSSRGWNIDLLKNDGNLCNHTENSNTPCTATYDGTKPHGDNHFPCLVKDNSNFAEELKKKLNFSCPSEVTCKVKVARSNSADNFYCLDMKKTIRGDDHQLVIQYDIEKQSFNFYSNFSDPDSITSAVDVTSASCKGSPPNSSLKCVNESCSEDSDACAVSTTGSTTGNTNGGGGGGGGGRVDGGSSPPPQNPQQSGQGDTGRTS